MFPLWDDYSGLVCDFEVFPAIKIDRQYPHSVVEFSKYPPIPNKIRPIERAGCESIYYQLALLHRQLNNHKAVFALSADFIAELYETARCDDVHDLLSLRC